MRPKNKPNSAPSAVAPTVIPKATSAAAAYSMAGALLIVDEMLQFTDDMLHDKNSCWMKKLGTDPAFCNAPCDAEKTALNAQTTQTHSGAVLF
jgi:hypothetical protein